MSVTPPGPDSPKWRYKIAFGVICGVSLLVIIFIGYRQYQAAARADATQKELQASIDQIKRNLESADVVRRLTGEGYLETKDLLTVPGTFLPGHKFKVHVVTENAGAGRVNDPLTVRSMNIQENAGNDGDRNARKKFEEQTIKYRTDYLSGKSQAPQVQGGGSGGWVTMEYQFTEGDIEELQKDTKRLYVFTLYGWTDSQGQKLFALDCRYLQAWTLPQSYEEKDVVWQRCR
jgi:hypothetical protein